MKEEIANLKKKQEEVEKKQEEVEEKNEELQFCVSVLDQQKMEVERNFHHMKRRLMKQKAGIHLNLSEIEDKVSWFRTKDSRIHNKLFSKLTGYLKIDPTSSVVKKTPGLLLDLLFFTFSTRLPFETIAKSFYVDDQLICSKTLINWFDGTLEDLLPWAKSQIFFLSDEEWIHDSWKIRETHEYQQYWKTLFYFTDGTVVERQNSGDPLISCAIRNGKHTIPAYMFFVVVSSCGRIVYLSNNLRDGSVHDKTHWNEASVVKELTHMYSSHETCVDGETFKRKIGGDKAYPYINKPEGWGIRIIKSGEETRDLDKEGEEVGEKAKNAQLKDVVFDPTIV